MAAHLQQQEIHREAVVEQVLLVQVVLAILAVLAALVQPHLMEQHTLAAVVVVV
jgi:hypothetical protein